MILFTEKRKNVNDRHLLSMKSDIINSIRTFGFVKTLKKASHKLLSPFDLCQSPSVHKLFPLREQGLFIFGNITKQQVICTDIQYLCKLADNISAWISFVKLDKCQIALADKCPLGKLSLCQACCFSCLSYSATDSIGHDDHHPS